MSVRFVPSRVEGLPGVTCVVVHSDRIELESEGAWRSFAFSAMGCPTSLLGRLLRPLGVRVGCYVIGARDCFHEPRDQFFRFDASPPFTVFLEDAAEGRERELFARIRDCINLSGRYVTDDLG